MANINNLTYEGIERPYNNLLERSDSGVVLGGAIGTSSVIGGTSSPSGSGGEDVTDPNQIGEKAISGQSFEDMWITTWIKSINYKPQKVGFLIDGRNGYIECMKLYVGEGGVVGGKLDIPDTTTANSFHADANGNTWWGATTLVGAVAEVLNTGVANFSKITIGSGTDVTIGGFQVTGTNFNLFGDGSDGDVTISVDTALTRDMYYNNLTINNGIISSPSGYKIHVLGTLTITGTMRANGGTGGNGTNGNAGAGTGGNGGAAGASSFTSAVLDGGSEGVIGADASDLDNTGGSSGTVGAAKTSALDGNGVAGGAGGDSGGQGGGSGGGGGAATSAKTNVQTLFNLMTMRDFATTALDRFVGRAGSGSGGSGANDATLALARGGGGGGSGGNGGVIWITAKLWAGTGTIETLGGTGGNGGNGSGDGGAGGGGGGGGNGGTIIVAYNVKTFSGSTTVTGGTGGTKGNSGLTAGLASNGTTGNSGKIIEIQI